jgi:hypothetical protein
MGVPKNWNVELNKEDKVFWGDSDLKKEMR